MITVQLILKIDYMHNDSLRLVGIWPNPANHIAKLRYFVPCAQQIKIIISNVLGEIILKREFFQIYN